jgi:hypothetical protein
MNFKNIAIAINFLLIVPPVFLIFFREQRFNASYLVLLVYVLVNVVIIFLSKKEWKVTLLLVSILNFIAFAYCIWASFMAFFLKNVFIGKVDTTDILLVFFIIVPIFFNFLYFLIFFIRSLKKPKLEIKSKTIVEEIENKGKYVFPNKSNLLKPLILIIAVSIIFFIVTSILYPETLDLKTSPIYFIILIWILLILPIYYYAEKQAKNNRQLKNIVKIVFLISVLAWSTTLLFYLSFVALLVIGLIIIFKPIILFQKIK